MANHAKRRASAALENGAEALKDLPSEALDVIKELIQEVRDETLDLIESGRAQASGLEKSAAGAIRNNPLQAVCIALGVGCVFGLLLRRR
jgi:ElaB/YqjD/DUF883 family membrane-anchored ribosome-binding protein